MADICIIYAHPSKRTAKALYDILSPRYSVWWDEQIHSGDYRAEIERQLMQAKCVIPIWCRASRANQNVLDEADYAKAHNVPLLPLRIQAAELPLGFRGLHTLDLIGWKGDPADPAIQELLRNVGRTIAARPTVLRIGNKQTELPTFFRSVSSHETALQPAAALQALRLFRADALLVSAYDIIKEKSEKQRNQMISDLEFCRSGEAVVLLDSGNYEASRKKDTTWTIGQLHEALTVTPHDVAFCFDDLNPPSDVEGVSRRVFESVERDAHQTRMPVLPIVHAPRKADGDINFSLIPETMKRVCLELQAKRSSWHIGFVPQSALEGTYVYHL